MHPTKLKSRAAGLTAALVAVGAFGATGIAGAPSGPTLTDVPGANQKANDSAPPNRLSPELQQVELARGSQPLENPIGITGWYGYQNDTPSFNNPAFPQLVPTPQNQHEAQKTEPDKNTYLTFGRASGPDESFDYGTHFLFQGHEKGVNNLGYITRVNLDADSKHRVTLMATRDRDGKPLATIDGSTWDPFAQRLIFTTENQNRPTYAATASFPSSVEDVSGALGRGGYEGVQNDSDGNLWLVEDIFAPNKPGATAAEVPNSFVYRYVPRRPGDLHNGKLQALQVLNQAGNPITLESQTALNAPDQVLLHSYGNQLNTRWVTVHDTASDGDASFNANAAAKAVHATPFKRPEHALFRPGSRFTEFYFDETGDTNANGEENGDPGTGAGGAGGWGGIQRLVQDDPSANTGKITQFYRGNKAHTGLDNNAFLSRDKITFAEDAGDTLHSQRNGLDSGFVFDVNTDYSNPSNQPVRWLAEGRDPSATIDSASGGDGGKNDGDNEITGTIVSDGDPTADGILGAQLPQLFSDGWRWFWTQQHGDNVTYEVLPSP